MDKDKQLWYTILQGFEAGKKELTIEMARVQQNKVAEDKNYDYLRSANLTAW